jgi:7-cyano-7-deazaguanine reductase
MMRIEDIASVHLGKAGDGSVVKPYITPDNVDSSLLVAIPRQLNRDHYKIKENKLPFVGYDTWNCYEVSFLLENGFPVNSVVKISYPSDSKFIVESKSLKLYLNSFNMDKLGLTVIHAKNVFTKKVTTDLSEKLECNVNVSIFVNDSEIAHPPIDEVFLRVENMVDVDRINFPWYTEDPSILVPVDNRSIIPFQVRSNSLRSNCRVTNQPDWGDVYIYMDSEFVPSLESLLQYIVSMRKENHFHEEICECIYKRLYDRFDPTELFVACLYTRRGGIDINPVRASSSHLLGKFSYNMMTPGIRVKKTMRQ